MTTQTGITLAEFAAMPEINGRCELVCGEIIKMSPVKRPHSRSVGRLIQALNNWADTGIGGEVGTEAGFVLAEDPTTVRAPDVYYIGPKKLALAETDDGFWVGFPDLAVEVVSPSETALDIQDKVSDFLNAGTPLIWIVYPKRPQVVQYTADGAGRIFNEHETLINDSILPGLVLPIATIFQP